MGIGDLQEWIDYFKQNQVIWLKNKIFNKKNWINLSQSV